MNIKKATILITGGANGIGKQLAKDLQTSAEKIIIIDKDIRSIEKLKQTDSLIESFNCDLTDHQQVEITINKIFERFKVNIIINNAGLIRNFPLVSLLDKEHTKKNISSWQDTIATNLNATFYVTSFSAQKMIDTRTKGVIINMGSISATGNIGQSAYSAAKAAINALTVTWSKELAMFGIRTAAIAPGFFDAGSTHNSLSETQIKQWQENIPLKRMGNIKEIFSAVEFIITNDYFNGKILEIDGGLRI